MKIFKILVIFGAMSIILMNAGTVVLADAPKHMESSPNYLIILIPGIGGNADAFVKPYGDLKGYLEDDLGLKGYVYGYTFSDPLQSCYKSAEELGNPSNPHYWIGRAYNDFAKYKGYPSIEAVPQNERPEKVILITHSMGGLIARAYITSDYYQNDVVKLITIGAPHLGVDWVAWYKNFILDFGLGKAVYSQYIDTYLEKALENAIQTLLNKNAAFLQFAFDDLYVSAGHWTTNFLGDKIGDTFEYVGEWLPKAGDSFQLNRGDLSKVPMPSIKNAMDDLLGDFLSGEKGDLLSTQLFSTYWVGSLGPWYLTTNWTWPNSEAFWEMDPDGSFVKSLKNVKPHPNAQQSQIDPIKYRLISAHGVPTAHKDLIKRFYWFTPYTIGLMLPYLSEYHDLPTEGAKVYAALLSVGIPGSMPLNDGDMLVALNSSRGEGVEIFKENTKRYEYLFDFDELGEIARTIKDTARALTLAFYAAKAMGWPIPEQVFSFMMVAPTLTLANFEMNYIPASLSSKGRLEAFLAHGFIIEKIMESKDGKPSIIEQALDDTPLFGGSAVSGLTKSGIAAASVNTPTASFNDFDQAFVLLSDLDKDGNPTGVFQTVTVEAFTEGNTNSGMSFPIEFDGQKKWVSAVTVKEAPTAVKGVINTFLPKKLRQFQYSENFAAWKDVGEVDRWGNFTISGLQLAEGQNVIAFRAESWTGNSRGQGSGVRG